MNFYKLTVNSDNGFQAVADMPHKELLYKDLYTPYKFNTIDCIRLDLDKGKKKTDVLNMGDLSLEGFPMHKHFCNIIKTHNLAEIQFIDIVDKDLNDYSFVFFNTDLTQKLDYQKSDFMFVKDFLGDIEELEIKIPKNRDGAIKTYKKHIHDSTFNVMKPRNGYHFISGFDINKFDVFRIGYFDKSFYVSERMKTALEQEKITGVDFTEAFLFDQKEPVIPNNSKRWWKFGK